MKTEATRIDAHHHLWRYRPEEFGWIDEEMAGLRRDFLIRDLWTEMQAAKVDGTVVVQARESLEETRWLLECAQAAPFVRGVVGWAPMEDLGLEEILGGFHADKKLVGLREIVQGKAEGYLDRPEFNRGIARLAEFGLTYDVLIYERQLVEAARFVDRHPEQRFVLDHAAKPKIAMGELEPWRTNLVELARRPNVVCKVSGLVTEADWKGWTLESLRPYLDGCVEAFGTERLLAGSDWPVCRLACTYAQWWELLEIYFAEFSQEERRRIFGGNAMEAYQLGGVQPLARP